MPSIQKRKEQLHGIIIIFNQNNIRRKTELIFISYQLFKEIEKRTKIENI